MARVIRFHGNAEKYMQEMKKKILSNLLVLNPSFNLIPLFKSRYLFAYIFTHSSSSPTKHLNSILNQKLCGYRKKILFSRLLGDLLIIAEYLNKVFYAFSHFLFFNFLSASLHHLSRSTIAKCHDNILLFLLFFAFNAIFLLVK